MMTTFVNKLKKIVFSGYKMITFEHSQDNISRVAFNLGEKRIGYTSAGYHNRCDIKFDYNQYIRLSLPDLSLSNVEIKLFLEQIENDEYLWEFMREIGRLLKDDGTVTIEILDLEYFSKNKLPSNFWNLKKRYLYSAKAFFFNSIYSYVKDCKRVLDLESVLLILKHTGFKVVKIYGDNSFLKKITVQKDLNKIDLWKLTNTLPKEGEIEKDSPIYLFDCDSTLILENLKHINLTKIKNRNFISVVGSLFFLNLIPYFKPENILLFDINVLQVRYVKLIIELILLSNNFDQFLSNFFSRKYTKNIEKFLSQPANENKYLQLRKKVSDKEIFDLSLGKIKDGKYLKLNGLIPVISIENNSMCQNISIVKDEYFKPGPRINVINLKYGLSKNYKYIKHALKKAITVEAKLEDKYIIDKLQPNSLIYVSNIGEEDWLNGTYADFTVDKFKDVVNSYKLSKVFIKQWSESVKGFKKFIQECKHNFWIIDSSGNIFNSNSLFLERSDSHIWLWNKIKNKIIGSSIEIIHKKDGQWGFKEYLTTLNYKKYLFNKSSADTIILHILLANGVPLEDFLKILHKASNDAKRIIIMEHDRDSVNFGNFSDDRIVDIRSIMQIIRSIPELCFAEKTIEWSGASKRIDKNLHDDAQNYNRNVIITIDL